jgi:hypothetical protein
MATNAMVATPAITTESRITMNQAARFAFWGEGWVIPMVLMKALAMSRMKFMIPRRLEREYQDLPWLNRAARSRIYSIVLAGVVAGAYT